MVNKPADITQIRKFLAEYTEIELKEDEHYNGINHRQHPRFRVPKAPLRLDAAIPFRLSDLSAAGFSFYTGDPISTETQLKVKTGNSWEIRAVVLASRALGQESTWLTRDLRHQVHCRFEHELDAESFESLVSSCHQLRIERAE